MIKEMHLEKYFFVPKKYLFPLKKLKGEKLNRFILVEDKISLLEKDDFIRFWRSNKIYEYLLPVAKLLWHSRIKDLHPSNLKRNENGKLRGKQKALKKKLFRRKKSPRPEPRAG